MLEFRDMDQPKQRPRHVGSVSNELIYETLMQLLDEQDRSREQWQEAERNLLERTDDLDRRVKELEGQTEPCPPPNGADG